MSFRTGFLVRNPVFGKRRSLASGAHWARDDKSLNHQNLPDTVLVQCDGNSASLDLSSRTGFLVRDLVFSKRRSLASLRDDKYLNHQNLGNTALVQCYLNYARLNAAPVTE